MKKRHGILAVLLALALVFALCACGGKADTTIEQAESPEAAPDSSAQEAAEQAEDTADLSAYAGEYAFFCVRFGAAYFAAAFEVDGAAQDIPDQYVEMPEMEGETVTLEADGTGYLYWGDDNQGPIDWWTVDGGALQFQAGVAVIDGTIGDGVMTVEIDDGFSACFALPGADTSGIEPVSVDDYIDLLFGGETETSPAEDMPLEGEYTLFAIQNDGYTADSNEMEMYSTLTLNEGGTGSMTMDEDVMDIESWSAEDGMLNIVLSDGSSAQAVIGNGILELDIWGTGDMILYYAQDGADISGYELMSVDEILASYAADVPDSRLYALWSGLDTAAGVHLSYDRHVDYMDSDQSFDVHGKDGVYYSRRTTYVSGFENTVVTFFRDGTAYNLYPEDMTGLVATTTTSSFIAENIMSMDDLYSDIRQRAQETDYTEETRELDGVSYTVEVFPATEYTPEAAFYFNDAGELAYYIAGAPVVESAIDIGESVYTIHAIDDAVDEALFDISGYDIAE